MLYKRIGPFFKWILETFVDGIFFPYFFSWIVLNIGMHPSSLVTLLVLGVFEFIFLLIILSDQVIIIKYFRRCCSCCCYYKVKQKVSFQIYILHVFHSPHSLLSSKI
jgi:hypothetical protein